LSRRPREGDKEGVDPGAVAQFHGHLRAARLTAQIPALASRLNPTDCKRFDTGFLRYLAVEHPRTGVMMWGEGASDLWGHLEEEEYEREMIDGVTIRPPGANEQEIDESIEAAGLRTS